MSTTVVLRTAGSLRCLLEQRSVASGKRLSEVVREIQALDRRGFSAYRPRSGRTFRLVLDA